MPTTCPNCSTTNADESQFCISCGRPLPSAAGVAPPPPMDAPPPQQAWPTQPQAPMAPPPMAPPPPGGYAPPPYGAAPGPYGAPAGGGYAVNNNMTIAIIATVVGLLCSCLGVIPGVVAIIMASQVNGKLSAGDVAGAQQSAKSARTWAIIAFIVTGGLLVIGLILNIVGATSFHFSSST